MFLETTTTTTTPSFWDRIAEFFISLWEKTIGFAEDKLPRFIIGVILFVVLWLLLKIILKRLRKTLKINEIKVRRKKKVFNQKTKKFETKHITVDNTLRRYVFMSISVLLKVLIILIFLAVIQIDLTGFAQIASSAILAIGLSAQDFIKNFFAGLLLIYNKYVSIGDFINANKDAEGYIKEIGAFSTVIDNVDGQEYIVPNSVILNNTTKNFDHNPYRRVVIRIGVDYGTDVQFVRDLILGMIKDDERIIHEIEGKKPQVVLESFDTSAIVISVRFFASRKIYWDMLFEYNEKILNALNNNNIKIPTSIVEVVSNKPKTEEEDE